MIKWTLFILMFLLYGVDACGQCAMCKTTIVNNVSQGEVSLAEGLNFGILYLFFMPYVAVLLIGFLWYRKSKWHAKKSLSKALLTCKCPRCRKGQLFVHSPNEHWFSIKMHKACPICKQNLEPEPGFYFGAMYVSYALSLGLIFTVGLLLYFPFSNPSLWVYLSVITGGLLLLYPLIFKYSRTIFLYLFGGVGHDPSVF